MLVRYLLAVSSLPLCAAEIAKLTGVVRLTAVRSLDQLEAARDARRVFERSRFPADAHGGARVFYEATDPGRLVHEALPPGVRLCVEERVTYCAKLYPALLKARGVVL